jgi:hypothetical protein
MPAPLVAAAGMVALRALPMIAGAAGRGAAAGAARMGASQGVSRVAGGIAEGQTIRAGVSLIDRMRGPSDPQVGPESRNLAFRAGVGPF